MPGHLAQCRKTVLPSQEAQVSEVEARAEPSAGEQGVEKVKGMGKGREMTKGVKAVASCAGQDDDKKGVMCEI